MMLSNDIQHLLYLLAQKDKEKEKEELKPKVGIKTSVGLFAFVYERIRNFVDYQEEHLLLRRAITRILVRRVKTSSEPRYLIDCLVNELLMARYLANEELSEDKLPQAQRILYKYLLLYENLGKRKLSDGESLMDFLLSLTAREIEELFSPSVEDQLVNFTLKKVEKRASWFGELARGSEEEKRTRLLIGLMRTLAKYDERTIYFKLWKLYFPAWRQATDQEVLLMAKSFTEADSIIKKFLNESSGEPLSRLLKKHVAPFEILRDLINRGFVEVEEIFSSSEKLTQSAFAAAHDRYHRALSSLRRSAVNSFVYIFITKMVFALAIEIPYELYVSRQVNALPILINLLFPPSLMLFMALTVESPTEKNTQKIVDEILVMTFDADSLETIKIDLEKSKSAFLTYLFRLLYALAFLLTFGLTVYVLRRLYFSAVSLIIFFFFLSTISFFAFRIRSAFKELVVGEEQANIVSNIFDFFMLPFIRLGRAISTGLSELNIFTFIFDIILEAPFKMILEIIEEWARFLREKKEEALNVIE
ncbi:MAG TPA: hypothetical protein VMW25_05340 [Clostridia bacterium]|nr:hypothetical protein [Clostridia bacterium]